MQKYVPSLSKDYLIKLVALFVIYYVTAKFGLSMFAVNDFATMIWAPTGIALAFLILYGYDLWPAVAIGAFVVNVETGASVALAIGITTGNTLEAIIGTYLLRKYVQLYRCFERLSDTLLFIGIVGLIATVISATIGVGSLWLGGMISASEISNTWFAWWVGNTLGALVIIPFLLTCVKPTRKWNQDSLGWIELISGTVFLVIANLLIFWYPFAQVTNIPLFYLILFPLIWAGIRFGSRGMTISVLITSIIATTSTILGHGPFAMQSVADGLLYLQIFIGTISITFLIFLSIVKERRLAMYKITDHVGELEHALQKIKSEEEAKNYFLATLAHELRNPLAPILSSIELLKLKVAKKVDAMEQIKTMETHVHIISRLLEDLLDISRISRKKLKLIKETFSLQSIIAQSVESTQSHLSAKNHSLKINLPEETVWLVGDPLRIEQALVNLIINAGKYTDPNGKIEIIAETEDDIVLISIKDNGMGIDSEFIERIFEPFLQITSDNMRTSGGLGIGLSLTKRLIELHNGHIIAKSKGLGHGSEFIITLPLPHNIVIPMGITKDTELSPYQNPSEIEVLPLQENKQQKILIVDDNASAADAMCELLKHKGYETQSIHDSREVLKIVKSFYPEIVILDIGMPYLDGYEVAKQIRAEFSEIEKQITLIALTGYGQKGDKEKATESGFDYHLTKPVSVLDVLEILKKLK